MTIDWLDITTKLLASDNPLTATANALGSIATVVHDFTKDDPVKDAKADKAISDIINTHLKHIQEAKDAKDLNKGIADLHNDLSK
jgi:hypothetical protein